MGGNAIETTFCLIDWYKLEDRKVTPTGNSACETPGLCGSNTTNR